MIVLTKTHTPEQVRHKKATGALCNVLQSSTGTPHLIILAVSVS